MATREIIKTLEKQSSRSETVRYQGRERERENTRRRRNDRRSSPDVSPLVSGNPEERTAPFRRVFPAAQEEETRPWPAGQV